MTEAEWSACGDCRDLLYLAESRLRKWVGPRSPRLLSCAGCRLAWGNSPPDPPSRAAIEIAERYCDGVSTRKELAATLCAAMAAYRAAGDAPLRNLRRAVAKATRPTDPMGGMFETLTIISGGEYDSSKDELVEMIRDVFGPRLLRPIVADRAWFTPAAIYEERAFDRLPILADALEGAGCTNADVLLHCRRPGEHVRGCWVVDLVLGKE